MIEEFFLQFGAMGLLGAVLFWQMKQQSKVVENNTVALTKVYEVMQHCEDNKK